MRLLLGFSQNFDTKRPPALCYFTTHGESYTQFTYKGFKMAHIDPFTQAVLHKCMAAAMQGTAYPIGSSLGLSVSPKDTATDLE